MRAIVAEIAVGGAEPVAHYVTIAPATLAYYCISLNFYAEPTTFGLRKTSEFIANEIEEYKKAGVPVNLYLYTYHQDYEDHTDDSREQILGWLMALEQDYVRMELNSGQI